VKQLLVSYKDEWSACWVYTRALIALRDGHAAQQRLVQDAWSLRLRRMLSVRLSRPTGSRAPSAG
jgi:hypothetical protein